MLKLGLKILFGNRTSFIGVIFGIFLATLLISQQSAIFLGLISRSYRIVTDITAPNIWVVDSATESVDKLRDMPEKYLDYVRSTPGIAWAVPLGMTHASLITQTGIYEICEMYGIDDVTLIGAPSKMIEGSIDDLRRSGGIIVDIHSAQGILAVTHPDGTVVPLKIGDELEINNRHAIVVGICNITPGFYPQPIIFTSFTEFKLFNPTLVNNISFILAKTLPDANLKEVLSSINSRPGINALTSDQLKQKITDFFLKTGILINFGLSVALGIIIGFSISGQIFYTLTLENLMYYALIKSLGGTHRMLFTIIIVQALLAGALGFVLGTAVTLLWGEAIQNTTLAFLFPWQLLLFTGGIILTICLSTAALSLRKVYSADPKVLLGN